MERYLPLLLGLLAFVAAGCTGELSDDDDDAAGDDDDTVAELLDILTDTLPDGRRGEAYEAALSADSTATVTWSLDAGSLPPGIELSAGGDLTGTPTATGEFGFTVLGDDGTLLGAADLSIYVPPVLLLSGFGPFVGYEVNPSIEAIRSLDGEIAGGMDVHIAELPVVWDESWDILLAAIEAVEPDVILSTGVAGTDAMRYELDAVNTEWGADVEGVYASGEEVVEGGPSNLETLLPVEEMAAAVDAAGLATTLSTDAGTYLCNHIFYHVVHYAEYDAPIPTLAGFVHVPPVGDAGCTFALEDVTEAHELGIEALSMWMRGDRARAEVVGDTHDAPIY